ncbi:MAG: hypothetical protein RR929_04965 [Erysipelotrichaceae bacterium]
MNINAEVKKCIVKGKFNDAKKLLVANSNDLSISTYNRYLKIITTNKLHNDNRYNHISKEWDRTKVIVIIIELVIALLSIILAIFIPTSIYVMLPISILVLVIGIYKIYNYNKDELNYLVSKRYDDSRKSHIETNTKYEIKTSIKHVLVSIIPIILMFVYLLTKGNL